MNPTQIIAAILAGEQIFTAAANAYAAVRNDLSAADQAQVDAQLASSGANLDAVRKTLDADAA